MQISGDINVKIFIYTKNKFSIATMFRTDISQW